MKAWFAFLIAFLTIVLFGCASCTLLIQTTPRHGQGFELIRIGTIPASSTSVPLPVASQVVTAPAPPVAQTAAPCGEYHPPVRNRMPGLPKFSDRELNDSMALNQRLGAYISELRDYVLDQEKLNDDAYASYLQTCNPVPAS